MEKHQRKHWPRGSQEKGGSGWGEAEEARETTLVPG